MSLTATQLKNHFLEIAAPLVDEYVGAALGEAQLMSVSSTAREETWALLKELILRSSERIELTITSMEDILRAVETGGITLDEGERLVRMYKAVKEANAIDNTGGDAATRPVLNITLRDDDGEREIKRSGGGEGSSKVATGGIQPGGVTTKEPGAGS